MSRRSRTKTSILSPGVRMALCCLPILSNISCEPTNIIVRVKVNGLSSETTSLRVDASLDGKPAMQSILFTEKINQFTVRLPAEFNGPGLLRLDTSGFADDQCQVSGGTSYTAISRSMLSSEVEVTMASLTPRLCPAPSIRQVTPTLGPTAGGISLIIDGERFVDGAQVTIAGRQASGVTVASNRITAMLPAHLGAWGKADVAVLNPDGKMASRNDLFAYYASQSKFQSQTYNVGTQPYRMAIGDFNGDQSLDLVVANQGSNNVSVLFGNGAGGFTSTMAFAVGSLPYSVAVADFNRDGALDLAVTNQGSNNVSILLGNGSGGFGSATDFSVGATPISIVVADFNGDQNLDFAVANFDNDNVSVRLGNGLGGFNSAGGFDVGRNPRSIAAGDFNNDKVLDLVVANSNANSNSVSLVLGDGTGRFGTANGFLTGKNPQSVIVGDFNGDQKVDVATANSGDSNVSVLLGNGLGVLSSPTNFPADANSFELITGDLNGDLMLDLAVANSSSLSSNLSVLLGDGKGGFAAAVSFKAGNNPQSVVAGDFNGDRKIDLVYSNAGSSSVSVLINQSL